MTLNTYLVSERPCSKSINLFNPHNNSISRNYYYYQLIGEKNLMLRGNKCSFSIHMDIKWQSRNFNPVDCSLKNTCCCIQVLKHMLINMKYKICQGAIHSIILNYCEWKIGHTNMLEFLSSTLVSVISLIILN